MFPKLWVLFDIFLCEVINIRTLQNEVRIIYLFFSQDIFLGTVHKSLNEKEHIDPTSSINSLVILKHLRANLQMNKLMGPVILINQSDSYREL